jgi:hypothetical protein
MKKAIMLTLAALLVVGAPAALAQRGGGGGGGGKSKGGDAPSKPLPPRPEFTTGIVSSYVPESRTLKFNTGGEYKLTPAAVAATTIHAGDKVQLRWLMKGGLRIADEAMITQAGVNPAEAVQASKPAAAAATTDKPAATTTPASPS